MKIFKRLFFILFIALFIGFLCYVIFTNINLTNNIDDDSVKVSYIISSETSNENNDSVKIKVIVENKNKFDILMKEPYFEDNDLQFAIQPEGFQLIKANESFEKEIQIIFNNSIDNSNYVSVLNSKNIVYRFVKSSANQSKDFLEIIPIVITE